MRMGRAPSAAQVPGGIEVALVCVLLGEHGRRKGPDDPETRIVPADSALVLRRIELVDEVEGFGVVREREKAMREALRDVEHLSVLGAQLDPEAATKRR